MRITFASSLLSHEMKHYILLSVEVPPHTENTQYSKWVTLERRLESMAKTCEGMVQLAPSVWLLPRDQGMPFAAECIAVARASDLKAEARFLTDDS